MACERGLVPNSLSMIGLQDSCSSADRCSRTLPKESTSIVCLVLGKKLNPEFADIFVKRLPNWIRAKKDIPALSNHGLGIITYPFHSTCFFLWKIIIPWMSVSFPAKPCPFH
jgi:hypothetical protein